MALRAMLLATFVAALALVPLSPAAPGLTSDQQLVAGLDTASAASRAALRNLTRPSAERAEQASADLRRALAALATASKVAPRAVGALEIPSVRTALRRAQSLGREAARHTASGRYTAARFKIEEALKLEAAALEDFGVPLEKEFPSFVVHRDFTNVPGFTDYSGLSASVGDEVGEVVIGAANRTTANAREPYGAAAESAGLPITDMSSYIVSDPIGNFRSGWCKLAEGLIACKIEPAMPEENIFTIAYTPKLPRGTKLLVKFRSTGGQRSYSVFTTR